MGILVFPPVAYQYLFAADREIQQEEIIGYLKEGKAVISDRYFWSSVAYGIADREGMDYEDWENVSRRFQHFIYVSSICSS